LVHHLAGDGAGGSCLRPYRRGAQDKTYPDCNRQMPKAGAGSILVEHTLTSSDAQSLSDFEEYDTNLRGISNKKILLSDMWDFHTRPTGLWFVAAHLRGSASALVEFRRHFGTECVQMPLKL
jgi:hypothetical protein